MHLDSLPPLGKNFMKNAALVVVCVMLVAGIVIWTTRDILKFEKETAANVNQYMLGVAREKAQCVEQFIQETQDYLALLSRKPFSGEFKKEQPIPYNTYNAGDVLLDHVRGRVDSIYRLDSKGKVLQRIPHQKTSIGKDFSAVPGISSVLKDKTPHISEIFELSPGEFGFEMSHPVMEGKNLLGVICFLIPLKTLDESVCHIQASSGGNIWIISESGQVISHSDPSFIGKQIFEVEPGAAHDPDFMNIITKMTNGEEGYGVYQSVEKGQGKTRRIKKAAVFLPVNLDDHMWSIALTMNYEDIAAPIKKNTRNNFLGAVVLMLIVGAAGSSYYRSQKKRSALEAVARTAEELRLSNEKLKHEIQQRSQAEKAKEETENNYRLLAENVRDIIWTADLNFRFTYISPSIKHVLGFEPAEIIGIEIQKLLSPTSISSAKKAFMEEFAYEGWEQRENPAHSAVDLELFRKDGTAIWAETKFSFLYDSEGMIDSLLGVTRDITEKMQLQQQFIQAQKMESIGTLAGGIAHDFNNLLGGILGYASLMKTKTTRGDVTFGYADTIEKSANRAAELTGQLLAFARGGKFEPRVVALNRIVRETLEIIGRTFEKQIEIQLRLDENIPTVEADAAQMQQVLMNLCVNARDAMPRGGYLTIQTFSKEHEAESSAGDPAVRPGPYVGLCVADTGNGMNEETKARIFEPFFTTKEKGKGTGLGLSMVYGVVKNHAGFIEVDSKPGRGSTFSVFLPASGKTEIQETRKPKTVQHGNELILVVDDEEVMRYLAKDVLESYGYRVLLASDGLEALDAFKQNGGIGLVIIDMIMPRMGGRETYLKLKELDPQVKALLSTGYDRNGEVREILRSGVTGFIQKPFDLDELLLKVRAALDGGRQL